MEILSFNKSQSEPDVSIVCVTFNAERFIGDLIQSIFQQDMIDRCELIIGDDCSQDNTVRTLKNYLVNSPCSATLISRDENVGAIENWLYALSRSRGRFIAWVDGDDYFLSPRKLTNDLRVFDSFDDCNLVFSPSRKIKEGLGASGIRNAYKSWDASKVNLEWVLLKGGGFYPSSSVVFKTSVLMNLPSWFMVTHCTGDLPLAAAAVLQGGTIRYRDSVDTAYRIHAQSLTHAKPSLFRAFRDNQNKMESNCNFFRRVHEAKFISSELFAELVMKERYVFLSKLLDRGAYTYCIKKGFGTLSLPYLSRLYLKVVYLLIRHVYSRSVF